jgi:hypothetical protein
MEVRAIDENAVKVIVNAGFADYEEKTGLPRHKENLGNFEKLFGLANRGIGIMLACAFFVGIPAALASIIEIVKFVKGHP